ncbi:sulfatase [Parafilimonas sp.]|uniref:sulfatase family protein n=1 Tax=Parafilimonas sp. TaxID=1969739 RepID=UPI0039E5973A
MKNKMSIIPVLSALFIMGNLFFFECRAFGQVIKENQKHPNIIFLLTDDQRWDALGVMGNPIIKTPNLDKLAAAGVLFQNAYVTTSICCVSRASILSGQYESRHQINDFATSFSAQALSETYPALLKKAGYNTAFIGKFGVGKGNDFPAQLFNFYVNTEAGNKGQPDYLVPDAQGNLIHDNDTIDHAIQLFLDKYGKNDAPFCLSVSFKAPHELDGNPPRYIVQDKYKDYYNDVTIPEPVTANPKYWEQFPPFFRTDSNFARARWKGLFGTPGLYQENVKNYYRLITGVDDVVGNTVKKLKALGIDSNTIIIYMGDNGFFLGEHGMEGKWYGYEESVRVPLFIYSPFWEDKIRQTRSEKIALNIDIAPTILAMAGAPAPSGMQGINLISQLENKTREREAFFYQYYYLGGKKLPEVEGVVTKDFKYMIYIEHGYEELFDTKNDPHETVNLAKDPAFQKKLRSLRLLYNKLKAESR